jgi:hypothetical protein
VELKPVCTPFESKEAEAKPASTPFKEGIKCKSAEEVVNCLDRNLTEIKAPVLSDFLSQRGLSYIPAMFQLQARGWKLDSATRTFTKEAEA